MDADRVRNGINKIEEGIKLLQHGPLDYYLRTLVECYDFLLTLCPHKIGDRVMLIRTPEINEKDSWGWMAHKHYLKSGEAGTVVTLDADKDGFKCGVQFENETWIDSDGNKNPVSEPSTFNFRSTWLVQAPNSKATP